MILVDALKWYPTNKRHWCHMMSTEGPSAPELHRMAALLGLKRCWFMADHYDLIAPRRAKAVELGALQTTSRHLAYLRRQWRARARAQQTEQPSP